MVIKTHYAVLGVPPNADAETVKAAYRKLVKGVHPDLHRDDDGAELRSKQINTAYAVLRDRKKRARYDEQLRRRRGRAWLFLITLLVSAGLVSGSTLFVLNFLLKPNGDAPASRISARATDKVALAEDLAPAADKSMELAPPENADAAPAGGAVSPPLIVSEPSPPVHTASLPEPAPTLTATETAWREIEENGSAEDIWVFMERHAGTPQAAQAEKRLEPLIDAIDDIASLKALLAKTTGGVAKRVLGRLGRLAARSDVITAALPEPTAAASQSEASPATVDESRPPASTRAPAAREDGGAKLASSDPPAPAHQALSLMSNGQYIIANPLSRDSAPITRGDAKYHVYRAGFWASRGDLDRAIAGYDTALLIDTVNIAAFHGRGLLRWRRGEGELALADFDRAIRLSFADPKIYLDRGMIWYERGRYDRAIADFNQAIKLAPHSANAYSYRGTALRRKREFKSAIADLDQAIRLDPGIADAYRNRDLARTESDDPMEAASETLR